MGDRFGHDPFKGYDQWKTASPYDDEPDDSTPPDLRVSPLDSDYCLATEGDGDDVDSVHFDFAVDRGQVRLCASVDCGTSNFVDSLIDTTVPVAEAEAELERVIGIGSDWFPTMGIFGDLGDGAEKFRAAVLEAVARERAGAEEPDEFGDVADLG